LLPSLRQDYNRPGVRPLTSFPADPPHRLPASEGPSPKALASQRLTGSGPDSPRAGYTRPAVQPPPLVGALRLSDAPLRRTSESPTRSLQVKPANALLDEARPATCSLLLRPRAPCLTLRLALHRFFCSASRIQSLVWCYKAFHASLPRDCTVEPSFQAR
jgi:hypothetical protein